MQIFAIILELINIKTKYMPDLKQFRIANKMTQSDLAKYFECQQGFISQMELGNRPIPEDYISKLIADSSFVQHDLLKSKDNRDRILIPFYDDVTSIGGMLSTMPPGKRKRKPPGLQACLTYSMNLLKKRDN